ncbi:MAG: thrombospondin type 3 repeat-containing protein [Myxococcota bacterium]
MYRRHGQLLLAFSLCCSCGETEPDGDRAQIELTGAAEKGPFLLGSTITVSPIDDSANLTGEVFTTQTEDDTGRFSVRLPRQNAVALSGSGFYYNEVLGQLSAAPIVLRGLAMADGTRQSPVFVNVLTHLTYNRALTLIGEGQSPSSAASASEAELYETLGIGTPPNQPANEISLLGNGDSASGYLLAVSAVLLQAATDSGPESVDATLQELLNSVATDFGEDGEISSGTAEQFSASERRLDVQAVSQNLRARAAAIGSDSTIPELGDVLDSDADGLPNSTDNCPFVSNDAQTDSDNDSVGDACECGNGIVDVGEECDSEDRSTCTDDCRIIPDADDDGVPDAADNCASTSNADQRDQDVDGIGDACDQDLDGDGVSDFSDNCPSHANSFQLDTDQDGLGDICDDDDDRDGLLDADDNCRLVPGSSFNPEQCQDDEDNDGVQHDSDNCPGVANPSQVDLDGDGAGNDCDLDIDGDGFFNWDDNCINLANADQADTDKDGIGDACDF